MSINTFELTSQIISTKVLLLRRLIQLLLCQQYKGLVFEVADFTDKELLQLLRLMLGHGVVSH